MLAERGDAMDYISEHFYCGELPGLLGHVAQIPREVRRIAEAHRKYRTTIPALKGKDIRIALDEWNYWYGPTILRRAGHAVFLEGRAGDRRRACTNISGRATSFIWPTTPRRSTSSAPSKRPRPRPSLKRPGWCSSFTAPNIGTIPVKVSGAPEPLDVAAAWKEGKKVLTLAVVNPTKTAQTLPLSFKGSAFPNRPSSI